MNFADTMNALRAAGTAQNRKVYGRHGVAGEMFGVSYANLEQIRKRIGGDTKLAEQLWQSGNHDARVLATQIAVPDELRANQLECWCRDLNDYVLSDAFAKLASHTPHARRKMDRWIRARDEWRGRVGWLLCAHLARRSDAISDAEATELLERIESGIHRSKNRVRDAMNSALIAIGLRGGRLERNAIAAAKRIGKVEVDHGETSCKTPDAVAYIATAKVRTKKR